MNCTKVVNIYKEQYDVYIGRKGNGQTGYFGNPFRLVNPKNSVERSKVLENYMKYFNVRINNDIEFTNKILDLRGKILGCFCKPKPCHGDVIVSWINAAVCNVCNNIATIANSMVDNSIINITLFCENCYNVK